MRSRQLVAAQVVDGPVLGGGHEPRAGIIGDAALGPAFERGDEGVLREIFGETDVADDARECGDKARGLDAPDGVDGAVDVVAELARAGGLHQLPMTPPLTERWQAVPVTKFSRESCRFWIVSVDIRVGAAAPESEEDDEAA